MKKIDQTELKLNWDLLETRSDGEKNDFLYYEQNRLIGFLGLYGFGNKVEICGMVHPDHRRKGIFSVLLKEGLAQLSKRNVPTILLNIPASSETGKAFVLNQPFTYSFSEHQMVWEPTSLMKDPVTSVSLRQARKEELPFVVKLDADCFDMELEEAASMYKRAQDITSNFIIEHNRNPVGKLRWHKEGKESWMYGFAVMPEWQGKGIGRQALIQAVQKEAEKGQSVYLEVVPENNQALTLYQSCGFKSFATQDYYLLIKEKVVSIF
ncbi:GNAT family N-acetyltransferase [Halalkalibacter akibai]|uniref:N-acetyltransferase domain-containing protein n=1 Tax=Halalkalibacter akibai (strain ATCC 43226 / DSM 21942 / CIP 109018 / JCM 9157 / 1139) TaxID=1236973 RepID=W4QQH7_HALA3|nr:GNAT family N-acetyltransferase [Halalkalibacter akibai]GAE33589.1 hypothetical protein JCM9157_604 [Halalkalibacter akibai JCM 9157]